MAMCYRAALTILALLLCAALPGSAATDQEVVWNPAITGLTTGGVTIYLDREDPSTASDLASQSVAAITITEVGSTGRYYVDGLPGYDPGDDYNYILTICYGGSCWQSNYPPRTLAAANIVWGNLVSVQQGTTRYAVGATLPDVELIAKGLGQNPTGSTITFTVKSLDGQTTIINAEAGSISGITETVDEDDGTSTWSATLTYDVTATLTATAGNYLGRFTVTFADAEVLPLPVDRSMTIEVIR